MIDRPSVVVASTRAALRHPLRHSLVRLGLLGSGLLALLLPGLPAGAEVRAAVGGQSLGTRVNGVAGGGCSAGLCEVSGGTRADRNLFHRFSRFDTRGDISGVTIRNGTARNVIVGVTDPLGSFIDKPVSLARSGNLAWLSPGGLAISGAGGFHEVARLNLSTGTGLLLGTGVFDAVSTTASQAAALTGAPVWGRTGVVNDPASLTALGLTTNGNLSLSGGTLTVDQSLLLDAQGGNVVLQAAGLQAVGGQVEVNGNQLTLNQTSVDVSNPAGAGGSITVTGDAIALLGSSVQADGSAGGGQILVGGDERGANPAVPNARLLYADAGTQIGADGLGTGSGGRVILYSREFTQADALLSARGGSQGGDGGFVETSGGYLSVGSAPDLIAPNGVAGKWLIDPWDLVIQNNPPTPTTTISGSAIAWPPNTTATGSTAYLDVGLLALALQTSDVTIATATLEDLGHASTSPGTGTITLADSLNLFASSDTILTLVAESKIILNADITISQSPSGSLGLDLIAPGGVDWNGSKASGPIQITVRSSVGAQSLNGSVSVTGSTGWVQSGASLSAGTILLGASSQFLVNTGSSIQYSLLDLGAGSDLTINNTSGFTNPSAATINMQGTSSNPATLRVNDQSFGDGVFINQGVLYVGQSLGSSVNISSGKLEVASFANQGTLVFDVQGAPLPSHDILFVTGSVDLSGTIDILSSGSLTVGDAFPLVDGASSFLPPPSVSLPSSFSGQILGSSLLTYLVEYTGAPSPSPGPAPSPDPTPTPPPDPTPTPPPDPTPTPPPDPTPTPPPDPTPTPPPDPTPPAPSPAPSDISSVVQEPVIGSVLNQPILQPSTTQISVSGSESSFGTPVTVSSSPQVEASSDLGSGLTTTAASFETSDPLPAETPVASQPATAGEPVPAQAVASVATTEDQQKDQKDQSAAQASEGQSPEANSLAALTGAEAVQQGQPAPLAPSGAASLSRAGSAQSSPVPINVGGLQSSGRQAQPMATAQVSDSNQQSDARASEINRALNTEVAPADEAQQRAALEASQRPPQSGLSSSGQGLGPGSVGQPGVRP